MQETNDTYYMMPDVILLNEMAHVENSYMPTVLCALRVPSHLNNLVTYGKLINIQMLGLYLTGLRLIPNLFKPYIQLMHNLPYYNLYLCPT